MKKVIKCILAVSLLCSGLSFMDTQAMARIDLMANRDLVVLAETNLLDDYNNPDSVVGSISGMQMVEVACGLNEPNCLANTGGKEYIRIKTWMGKNGSRMITKLPLAAIGKQIGTLLLLKK